MVLGKADTPTQTRIDLRTLRFGITDLITKVRDEIFTLRNSAPIDFLDSLQVIADEIFPNTTISTTQSPTLTHTQAFELLRISTEVIRNASRHAGATHIDIECNTNENHHMLTITDNGNGGALPNRIGYGIAGLYERAESLGGTITITTDATGTSVEVKIPTL